MKFFKKYKNIKVTTIIKYLFLGILTVLISMMVISDIACAVFMLIKNTTGYCTPFMEATIEKISDINMKALHHWAMDW